MTPTKRHICACCRHIRECRTHWLDFGGTLGPVFICHECEQHSPMKVCK